jgi:hypothetical protein
MIPILTDTDPQHCLSLRQSSVLDMVMQQVSGSTLLGNVSTGVFKLAVPEPLMQPDFYALLGFFSP